MYQLDGLDKNWNAITDRTEVSYNDLSEGTYTSKVKAANSEGYWSNEFRYPFTIRPPWWKTWWAYLVYTVGLTIFVWAFAWYRSRRLRAEICSWKKSS